MPLKEKITPENVGCIVTCRDGSSYEIVRVFDDTDEDSDDTDSVIGILPRLVEEYEEALRNLSNISDIDAYHDQLYEIPDMNKTDSLRSWTDRGEYYYDEEDEHDIVSWGHYSPTITSITEEVVIDF